MADQSVVAAIAAADAAVAAATVVAETGTVEGKLAYQLTSKAIKDKVAPAVFPLIILSVGAITEGLAAYVAEQAAAKVIEQEVSLAMAAASANCQNAFAEAVQSLED